MNVIPFPGGKAPDGDTPEIARYKELKRRLVAFVLEGPMRGRLDAEMEAEGVEGTDFAEFVDFTDWFIFDWEGDDGTCVLDEFLDSQTDLSDEDQQMLEDWYEPVHDLFQVVELDERTVTLRDGDGDLYVTIPTNMTVAELGWRPRTIVETRLLKVGDAYTLSGIQNFYDGAELQLLPDGFNAASLAHLSDDEVGEVAAELAEEMADELALEDVRTFAPEERPAGSIAEAAHAFLAECAASLKEETVEQHALAASLLVHFCNLRDVTSLDELDEDELLRFVTVGYPAESPDRTKTGARHLLASVGKLTAWLDKNRGTALNRYFKQQVLPAVRDDLPRVMKASGEIDAVFVFFAISQMVSIGDEGGEPESAEGVFRIARIDGEMVTLVGHGHGAPEGLEIEVALPLRSLEHLKPGDFILCSTMRSGDSAALDGIEAVFPPAAPL